MKKLYQKIEEAAGRFVPVPYYMDDGHDRPKKGCKLPSTKTVDERYESSIRIAASRGSDITGFKGW